MSRNNRSNRGGRGGRGNRSDRLGSTLREIIADELRRIDDESVAYVAVTEVDVDNELTKARVYLSSLDLTDDDIDGVREHTGRIKRAIGQRSRLRRVPELEFHVDPGLVAGTRVAEILGDMADDRAFADSSDEEE